MTKEKASQTGNGKKVSAKSKGKGKGKDKGNDMKISKDPKKGICVCFAPEAIETLDEYAEEEDISRSAALRKLLKPILGKK